MYRLAANAILAALLMIWLVGCAKDPEYTPEETALIKLRAAATTRRASDHPQPMRDIGAETAQPKSSRCFGTEDTAARRLFILDGSGSMVQVIGELKRQLRDSIDSLDPQTAFNILIFQEDETHALETHWVMADPTGKILANDFIEEFHARGSSDPVSTLRKAFELHPQVIYFGTDGDFPNNAQILQTLQKLNANHQVKIHTISFGDGKEVDQLLKQIASENGGTFISARRLP